MNSPAPAKATGRVVVAGGAGFIGRHLVEELLGAGREVAVLSRDPRRVEAIFGKRVIAGPWNGADSEPWAKLCEGAAAVVNLVGENIAAGRWTRSRRQRIRRSRLDAGRAVVEAVRQVEDKPKVVLQSSGIGFYGDTGDREVDEGAPPGEGFLPDLAREWEESTADVETEGVRRAVLRTGIVLAADGGVLARMLPAFRAFMGAKFGSGRQWFPWIHVADQIGAMRLLMNTPELSGAFNLAAPGVARSGEFCAALGEVLERPCRLRAPAFALRLLFGEMAREVLLAGQRAAPARLLEAGYEFRFPELRGTLRELLGTDGSTG